MTTLSLAVRNQLAQDTDLRALLGRSQSWDTWMFDEKPRVIFQNKSRCLIVINEGNPWSMMNAHNFAAFPTIMVDVWADPTRDASGNMLKDDASSKIEAIVKLLDKNLHLTNVDDPATGHIRIFGTPQQNADKTGSPIFASQHWSGPIFRPVADCEGALAAQVTYAISTVR